MSNSDVKSPYLEWLREQVRALARAKGERAALRRSIVRIGLQRFGKPPANKQKSRLSALTDSAHLRRIRDRLLTATCWDDLMSTL
jgi:hypothetical protein